MRLSKQPQFAAVSDPQLQSALQNMWQQLSRTVNANVTYGTPASAPDNMKGAWYEATSSATPNTEFAVTHNLGYIPQGWHVMYQDKACHVYAGVTAWTNTQIFLKCDTASVHLRLFVIG